MLQFDQINLNGTSKQLQIKYNDTVVGDISAHDTTWLRLNQDTAKNIYTPRYIRADGGIFTNGGATYGITGGGVVKTDEIRAAGVRI